MICLLLCILPENKGRSDHGCDAEKPNFPSHPSCEAGILTYTEQENSLLATDC